jgi:exosome complex exonuclease DIS3/RRP44
MFLSYHRLFFYFFGPTSRLKNLPTATFLAGVTAGELHQGHFNANQYNYLEGSVQVPAFTKPMLLIGRENMSRAINGDVVVIEVFDKKDWKTPPDEVVDQDSTGVLLFY